MEHYVTLFDSKYLPHGIALYRSMEKWCGNFTLWVIALDISTETVLTNLKLNNCHVISLGDIETEALLRAKVDRTEGEYCWTLTPFTPQAVFERDSSVKRVTYIDADIWFRASPRKIFDEFEASEASVLLTQHGYSPESDSSANTGVFCVQFMTFARGSSQEIEAIWQEQCIQWCFARFEDNKFGDQKYLDSWPEQFGKLVHVISTKEWFQAPWNSARYPYSECVIYHFSGLQLMSESSALLGDYPLNRPLVQNVYRPYLRSLNDAICQINELDLGMSPDWIRVGWKSRLPAWYRYWRRRTRLFLGGPYQSM